MPSLLSHVLVAVLRLQRRQRAFLDPKSFRDSIERERRTESFVPPASLADRCAITRREVLGAPCYELSPRKRPRTGGHVLFLHGGCYVFEIDPHHWRFCASLVERLGGAVTVPIYPLAPEHAVDEALGMVTAAYREVIAGEAPGRVAIMGDSAGGGMALALAQRLASEGIDQPKDIVLLSPWLDAALDNPEIRAIEARDPWLARPGLIEAGRLYARGLDPKDPRVSPLFGRLKNLGALSIFIGTRELLLPDARRLVNRATSEGGRARLHEYGGMVHDFMLVHQLPEARKALAEIAAVLERP